MIPKNIVAALIVRICGASISFLASGFLCFTIWVSPKGGLQTPYSRIIFGFSIADILQSLGMILSPFLSPADNPESIFSRGTVASCEGIGLLFVMGSHAITWYILFLTYYFLKRVKYKQTPKDFAKCEEKFIFAFIWIYAIVTSVYPLIEGEINATIYGSVCMIAPRPFNCGNSDLIECTRGENAKRSSIYFSAGPIVAIFLLLIVVLGTFTCYMYNAEKALQPPSSSSSQVTNHAKSLVRIALKEEEEEKQQIEPCERIGVPKNHGISCNDFTGKTVSSQQVPVLESGLIEQKRDDPKQISIHEPTPLRSSSRNGPPHSAVSEGNSSISVHRGMDLTKRAAHQSILYILAFILVYSGPLVAFMLRLSKTENTAANFWIISLFYPIGGFLNMLIYTRPKVNALKELIPDLPIFICFLVIILYGGETPSLADLQIERRAHISSANLPQNEVQESHCSCQSEDSKHSIVYYIKMLGFDVSSFKDSRDLDAKLEAIMRGHAVNPVTRTRHMRQDPVLEEEDKLEEEEEGVSIGDDEEDISIVASC